MQCELQYELQCVAVCCSVLQCDVWCSVVQCGAVWCSVVYCVAVRCGVLHFGVLCVHKGERVPTRERHFVKERGCVVGCVAVCCSVL